MAPSNLEAFACVRRLRHVLGGCQSPLRSRTATADGGLIVGPIRPPKNPAGMFSFLVSLVSCVCPCCVAVVAVVVSKLIYFVSRNSLPLRDWLVRLSVCPCSNLPLRVLSVSVCGRAHARTRLSNHRLRSVAPRRN